MKLYFDYNMKPNLEKLQPYKRENTNCIILFSDQGIYTATNKTLKKHIIQDNDIEKYDYHDNTYYIDKSIYEKHECILFHMTDLPFGRGGSPLQNLLLRDIEKTKISLIKITINCFE